MIFDPIYQSGSLLALWSLDINWHLCLGELGKIDSPYTILCCYCRVKTYRHHQKDVKPGLLGLTPVPNLYNLYLPHLNLYLPGLAVIHWYGINFYFLFLSAPSNIRTSVTMHHGPRPMCIKQTES